LRKLFPSSLAALCGFVLAAPPSPAAAAAPSSEVDACLRTAAHKHQIAPALLIAIAETESGFNPRAIRHPHTAGGDGTTDYGLMQINSGWLPTLKQYGVQRHHLMHPCVSADVGAWILAHNFRRLGVTWDAVGAYNAKTPWKRVRYSLKVYAKLRKHLTGGTAQVQQQAPSPRPFDEYAGAARIGAWEASND